MATAQINEIVSCKTILRNVCKSLKKDLEILDTYIKSKDDSIIIAHDSIDTIIVYSTNRLSAYIPKKYNGFIIKFIEIDKSIELKFDLKGEILV